jgi:CubicO group peptidase (beta-lactamase class C family)
MLFSFTLAAALFGGDAPRPLPVADPQINAFLASIRDKHKLPAIAGGILRGADLVAVGAVGVRKIGSPETMQVADQVHIGSNTKAMTATRIAMLVEQGKLKWNSTLASVFPELKDVTHPDNRNVTLDQLLTHRAGLPANASWWLLGTKNSTTEQRLTLLKQVLAKAPESKPGSRYAYSNVGYAVAAAMAERVTGSSWEELMSKGLFRPLKMSSAGFGPPGTKGKTDQPWGHAVVSGEPQPSQTDNAPVLGPAGTVHCSLPDYAKFIALHLQGETSNVGRLKPETMRHLHTPPQGENYACGWIVVERPWAGGKALAHSGSNTMWWATVWLAPKRGFAVLVATNRGDAEGQKACDEASTALIKYFEDHFAKKSDLSP